MQGKVEISGVNTAKLKTLSNQEMMDLIRRAQAGDEQARGRLVEGNLKVMVLTVFRKSLSANAVMMASSSETGFSPV